MEQKLKTEEQVLYQPCCRAAPPAVSACTELGRVTILSIPFGPRLVLMASATAAERGDRDRDRSAAAPGRHSRPPAPLGAPPRPPHPCRRRYCCCGSGRVCRGPGTRPWPGSRRPGRGRGPWAPRSPAWRLGDRGLGGTRGGAGGHGWGRIEADGGGWRRMGADGARWPRSFQKAPPPPPSGGARVLAAGSPRDVTPSGCPSRCLLPRSRRTARTAAGGQRRF